VKDFLPKYNEPILANSQAWKKVVMEEKSHSKPQVKGILSGFPVE
jgi:hypothetical protein